MELIEGHAPITPAAGIPTWDVDPYSAEVLTDPNPYYAELRARGPLVYIPKYSILAAGQYDSTREIFSDHERFVSSRGVGLNDFKLTANWRPRSIILEVDPPEHTRARKVMMRALSSKAVAPYRAFFRETAERLVDALIDRGGFDGVADLAETFPSTVFPKAVGMTDSNRRNLVDYGAMVFNSMGPDNDIRARTMHRAAEIIPWINASCARDRLTDDGLGGIVYAAADAGEITQDEAGLLVRSFLSAGVDTTVTGIGNALWCLASNPGEYTKLHADPSLAGPCFEEVLRFTSPVHTFSRTANIDTKVAGLAIAEGTKITCALGAANMDPDKWGDPEVFRADRKPVGHLAFGVGIHGCVGQNLGRAELRAMLEVIAAKVKHIEMTGTPVWRPNNAIRALDQLPLKFHPA